MVIKTANSKDSSVSKKTTRKDEAVAKAKLDRKRSLAAKKGAVTRARNRALTQSVSSLRLHHKIIAGFAVLVVLVVAIAGIRNQIVSYAATNSSSGVTITGLSNNCLDNNANNLTNKNQIQLWDCNKTNAQKWILGSDGSIRNIAGNYCLDVPGASKKEYVYLQLYKCNGTPAQKFSLSANTLVNTNTGFCATAHFNGTANGTRVWMKECHGTKAQKWIETTNGGTVITPPVVVTPAPPTTSAPASKWGSSWILGQTKPSASNTGTGIIRAKPTIVATSADGTISNGVLTITKSLKDRIVPYVVKVGANNLTIENNDIKGDPSYPKASYTFINTNGHTGTLAQFNELHSSFVNEELAGIQAANITARYNNVHHVVDGIKPTIHGDNKFIAEGNYIHDFMFYAPSKYHANTPVSKEVAGQWGETPWDHADGAQIEYDDTTGVRWYGNTIVALWAKDGLTTMPLPKVVKELSCFMLNGGRNIDIGYNWLDGGEYCINNSDANVTGKIYNNRFGRQIVHKSSSTADSSYYALMIASPGLTTTNNVWEDTGNAVPRRAN